jgi:hypothetical protein
MEGSLRVRTSRKFPPRRIKDEINVRTQVVITEKGLPNYAQAKYQFEAAKVAVVLDEWRFHSIQPQLKLKDDEPWCCAYSVVAAVLKEFGMDLTLESLQIEARGERLPEFDDYLNHGTGSDALSLLLEHAQATDAEHFAAATTDFCAPIADAEQPKQQKSPAAAAAAPKAAAPDRADPPKPPGQPAAKAATQPAAARPAPQPGAPAVGQAGAPPATRPAPQPGAPSAARPAAQPPKPTGAAQGKPAATAQPAKPAGVKAVALSPSAAQPPKPGAQPSKPAGAPAGSQTLKPAVSQSPMHPAKPPGAPTTAKPPGTGAGPAKPAGATPATAGAKLAAGPGAARPPPAATGPAKTAGTPVAASRNPAAPPANPTAAPQQPRPAPAPAKPAEPQPPPQPAKVGPARGRTESDLTAAFANSEPPPRGSVLLTQPMSVAASDHDVYDAEDSTQESGKRTPRKDAAVSQDAAAAGSASFESFSDDNSS